LVFYPRILRPFAFGSGVVEILSLRGTKQSHQKIASCLAMTDCNEMRERCGLICPSVLVLKIVSVLFIRFLIRKPIHLIFVATILFRADISCIPRHKCLRLWAKLIQPSCCFSFCKARCRWWVFQKFVFQNGRNSSLTFAFVQGLDGLVFRF
jgi:hypothetical protein